MSELQELWCAEHCDIKVDYREVEWVVDLVWVSEWGNPHNADWAEYTWEFYGETIDEALTAALEWAKALIPFERCGACDGKGSYGGLGDPIVCEECTGTGLANRTEAP